MLEQVPGKAVGSPSSEPCKAQQGRPAVVLAITLLQVGGGAGQIPEPLFSQRTCASAIPSHLQALHLLLCCGAVLTQSSFRVMHSLGDSRAASHTELWVRHVLNIDLKS